LLSGTKLRKIFCLKFHRDGFIALIITTNNICLGLLITGSV